MELSPNVLACQKKVADPGSHILKIYLFILQLSCSSYLSLLGISSLSSSFVFIYAVPFTWCIIHYVNFMDLCNRLSQNLANYHNLLYHLVYKGTHLRAAYLGSSDWMSFEVTVKLFADPAIIS